MPNDSSTGGYLAPAASPAPLEGQALNRFLQQIFAGITGLPGNMVRPRWQPEPPNIPPFGTDWMAFGIKNRPADTFASEIHDGTGQGSDIIYRQEMLEVLCTFYGPNDDMYASLLREGLSVAQNREILQLNAWGLVSVGDMLRAPDFIKERWIERVDTTVIFRRAIARNYPVLNILSSEAQVQTDSASGSDPDPYSVDIEVQQ